MRFFGYLWRFIERLVKAVQVIFFVFIVVFVVAAVSGLSGVAISVPDKAALIIDPDGMLVEQAAGETLDQALLGMGSGTGQTVVRDVTDALRRAKDDERIQAVVLLPDYLSGGGLSKQQVIAAAIADFRESGKPVIAMGDSFNQAQYYMASQADEIYMHDFGFVLIEGFGYYKTYFADAIDKLNVDVNVFRVGEYKAFVEPYLRNDMSDEDKSNARRWLEKLWEAYRRDVTEARGLSADAFDRYVNDATAVLEAAGGDAGKAAMEAGLVDGLKSHHEFRQHMIGIVGEDAERDDTYAHINYRTYLAATDFEAREQASADKSIGVIVAAGEIVDGEAPAGTIGGLSLARLIREATLDESIRAVVLQIDSPGGSMFASEVVTDELEALQASGKPLIASMSSLAASGGYYIAMPADEVWAAETTISGSIGVGAIFPTFQRSLASLGVSVDGIGTGKLSGQFSPVMELGEEGRRLLDISVRSAYDVFIDKVARYREMDRERVDELARGQIWIGADAYELGLVDQLGSLDDAIESAATLAGLPDDGWDVVYVERKPGVLEKLLRQYLELLDKLVSATGAGNTRLTKVLDMLAPALPAVQGWNDPRGIYYHCLCEIAG